MRRKGFYSPGMRWWARDTPGRGCEGGYVQMGGQALWVTIQVVLCE